ncbi:MAG: T9SS type A sorting domain-containing protein [Muribaculaceae bacterium]|nr:T9SS type A sorting domain-containing protein [Muribaculaceae bacterium]
MKQFNLLRLSWLMNLALLSSLFCKADTKVPCFIFSGNAETEHSIDLAKLNRITFGDNSMIISSSKDESNESVELLYSLYHHLEIGDGKPSGSISGTETIDNHSDTRLQIDGISKLLYLQSASDLMFSIGIFDINGKLLQTCELKNGDAMTLEFLSPGIYVALATDGKIKLNLKFILN